MGVFECDIARRSVSVLCMLYIPHCVSVERADPVLGSVGLVGLKSCPNAFFIGLSCSLHFCLLLFSLSLLSICWYCGAGVFGLLGCKSLSLSLALPNFFI